MSIRAEDKIEVCRHCLSMNLDGIKHGQLFAVAGNPEEGECVCVWPCNHAVTDRSEPRCLYCQPYTPEEMPF